MSDKGALATFPIEAEDILVGKFRAIMTTRATWITIVGSILAVILFQNLWGLCLSGLIMFGGYLYWLKYSSEVEERACKEFIAKSYRSQNHSLVGDIQQLRDTKYDNYADQLSEVLQQKKQIQETLYSPHPPTPRQKDIEKCVNSLCYEVSRDFSKIADINFTLEKKKEQLTSQQKQYLELSEKELEKRVADATQALKKTQRQLSPTTGKPIPEEGEKPHLDKALQLLNEETAYADRIRYHIDSAFGNLLISPKTYEPEPVAAPVETPTQQPVVTTTEPPIQQAPHPEHQASVPPPAPAPAPPPAPVAAPTPTPFTLAKQTPAVPAAQATHHTAAHLPPHPRTTRTAIPPRRSDTIAHQENAAQTGTASRRIPNTRQNTLPNAVLPPIRKNDRPATAKSRRRFSQTGRI